MKTLKIGLGCTICLAILFFAHFAESFERLPIIGGESIGSARLGMTEAEIKHANEDSPCPAEATFSGGRAVELRTSWGGGCATSEGMMASTYGAEFLRTLYGSPETIKEETGAHYEGVVAEWWYYYKHGLAFRIMYTEDRSSIVQMIAVIPKGTSI